MKILKYGVVLLLSLTLWSCGKGNPNGAVTIDPSTGKHPVGMAVASTGGAHVDAYFANPASCEGCHGKTEDLTGGIAKVSCSTVSRSGMSCHGGAWPHGTGFDVPEVHGQQVVTKGLALCQKCHGFDYKTDMPGLAEKNCIACHQLTNSANNAPHAFDWTVGTLKHSATNPLFAPTCGECHLGGLLRTTPVKLPAGIPTPTCTGTTALCHFDAGHKVPYISKADHGLAAHNNATGPVSCGQCHADTSGAVPRYNIPKGTNANLLVNGCENCHNHTGLAHPYGWLPGRGTTSPTNGGAAVPNTTSHTTANLGLAGASCSPCHALTGTTGLTGSPAPSCMTQSTQVGGTTVCHFTLSPVANPTGCKSCHANLPSGPDGTTRPNRNNNHSFHFGKLSGLACSDCHGVYGTGRTDHATGGTAVLSFAAKFSETGVGYASPNCNGVSCHGGKNGVGTGLPNIDTAPSWTSTAALVCLACHTRVNVADNTGGQYINVFSGFLPPASITNNGYVSTNLHELHMGEVASLQCTDCHNTTKLQGLHFANLLATGKNKTILPGAAAFSVGSTARVKKYSYPGTLNGPNKSDCTVNGAGCHTSETRSWF